MKNSAILFALLFGFIACSYSPATAQEATDGTTSATTATSWKDITLGPLFSGGAAVNAGSVAAGAKTGDAFSFSAGIDGELPITQTIAFDLGLVYDARGINFYQLNNDNNKVDYTLGYFSIRPEFRLGGFMIGVGLGLPVAASTTVGGQATTRTIAASTLNTLFELRLGATIPIATIGTGALDLTLEGSYALSKIVPDADAPLSYYDFSQTYTSSDNNGPLASAEIGIKYMFDLTH